MFFQCLLLIMNTTLINSVSEKHSFETVKIKDASDLEKGEALNEKKEKDNKSVKKDDPPALHVLAESSLKVSNTTCATTPTNVKSPRMVPLVYIQTPTNLKVPSSTGNSKSNPQIIVNANTQFQISALNKLKSNTTMSSVVLTQTGPNNKPQPIILQKNLNSSNTQTLIPVTVATSTGTKQTFAYLGTIIKPPGGKTSENQIVVPTSHLPAGLVSGPTNQKLLLTPMAMPKLTPRIPLTCSTTTSNQPKLSNLILPMALSTQLKNTNQSVINFKISNGQLQSDPKGGIKVLCDNKAPDNNNEKDKKEIVSESRETDNIKKEETKTDNKTDKVYELSISEVPTSTTRELSYTISIPGEEDKIIKLPSIKRTTSTESKETKCENDDSTQNIIARTEPQQIQRKVHEISILKKCNLNAIERKVITAESKQDVENDPVKSTNSDVKTEVRKVNPERRRKSQYTYLRDFDEVVVTSGNAWENKSNNSTSNSNNTNKVKQFQSTEITFTKLETSENESKEKIKKSMADVIEIEIVKKEKQEIPQLSSEDDTSIRNLLKWKDGIGILPGSKIKFHTNEFGLIEMLVDDDVEKTKGIKSEDEKPTGTEILCCKECGTYGMPSEFVSEQFCSKNCKLTAMKLETKRAYLQEVKAKRKKKKLALMQKQKGEEFSKVMELDSQSLNAGAPQSDDDHDNDNDNDNNSNDMLQDNKVQNYPWQGGKKGFSWAKYLDHVKGKAAPVKLFKDPFPYVKNGFRPGMKLEGIDPQHPSYFCVMSVSEVQGYRIRLHFDGYSENYDFWVNADSMDIFPIGWCEKNNHVLHPPPGFTVAEFNWTTYLKRCKATPAPRQLFAHRAGNSACPHGFRLGMKLEAVDKKNTSLICVATVADLMDNRFLVHFDSWDDIYDYWADPSSPYIHPVGWCDQFGHNLTPPNDYPDPESFTWEKYLKETKSQAAPVRAFKQRPSNGFKKDMRLEVVDKRVPSLIRVATVEDVRDHQIKVRFDGWPNKYTYWIDDDSPDIHPAGWCQKTGHPLESPLTPEDVYETFECPTVGCRAIGHVQGARYAAHNNAKDCPYSDENLDGEFQLTDRLSLTNEPFVQESVVPVSREPPKDKTKANNRLGRPPKIRRLTETNSKAEWPSEDDLSDTNRKRKLSNRESMTSPVLGEKNKVSEDINCRYKTIINSDYAACPSQQILVKHTHLLNEIIRTNSQDARTWTHDEVAEFVSSLPSCKEHSKLFVSHKIDGDAFLMLTQKDLVDILKFKLGPAIKLYNSIVLLRKNINFYN